MTAPVPEAAVAGAVAAARAHLRIAGGQEDAVLARLARTAFALAEAFTGAGLIARAHEDVAPAVAAWTPLALEPVRAITGVTGLPPGGGAPFALPVDAYAVDIDHEGRGWVRVTAPGAAARVAIAYQAGLAADWDALPAPVAQGLVLLMAHLFDERGGRGAGAPPAAVTALWRPWRRIRLERRRA
ncbi:head-tail connector protein [Sphingomonas lenta]|uniref:Phage gp6-like head-tail connector protein n=1 Tax=Sphingomonas lenta TaxID=1141887 RepID=A0A2A2SCH5_9SPHN|nr:hypothetical protein [Sphingomonas lenta]PAX07004.1 hypothetical protein CKY28_13150 [Sphingomonas lenta]